jgi:hypothetical protein
MCAFVGTVTVYITILHGFCNKIVVLHSVCVCVCVCVCLCVCVFLYRFTFVPPESQVLLRLLLAQILIEKTFQNFKIILNLMTF